MANLNQPMVEQPGVTGWWGGQPESWEIKNSNQMIAVGPVGAEGFCGGLRWWEPH